MLPSIGGFAAQAKRRKSELLAFTSAYESVVSLDVRNLLSEKKLTQQQREWLLLSRFGFTCVSKMCRVLQAIPASLTDSQKRTLVAKLCEMQLDQADQLAELIQSYCPHLIESALADAIDHIIILAPPTGNCCVCDRRLVTNHQTQVTSFVLIWGT